MRKTLQITTGRHPFQVAIVAACLLSSTIIMITGSQPRSLTRALPSGFVTVWLISLSLNALIALGGMYWRGSLRQRLMAEAGGLIGLATTTSVYSAALARLSGWEAVGTGGLVLGIAVACWWRAGQIMRDVHRLTRAVDDPVIQPRMVLTEPAASGDPPADREQR